LAVVELIKKQYHNLGPAKMEIRESHAGKNRITGRKSLEAAEREGQSKYFTASQIPEGD
jgi:hypothetical protein